LVACSKERLLIDLFDLRPLNAGGGPTVRIEAIMVYIQTVVDLLEESL